jgi:hypothetical protein
MPCHQRCAVAVPNDDGAPAVEPYVFIEEEPFIDDKLMSWPTLVLRGPWRSDYGNRLAAMESPALSLNSAWGFRGDLAFLREIVPLRALHVLQPMANVLEFPDGVSESIEELVIGGVVRPPATPARWDSLRSLRAGWSEGIPPIVVAAPKLEEIYIDEVPDDKRWEAICSLAPASVTSIEIGPSRMRHLEPGLALLSGSLRRLSVAFCRRVVDFDEIGKASSLRGLVWLDLTGCTKLVTLLFMPELRALQYLRIDASRNLESVAPLAGHPTLRRLDLTGSTSVGDRNLHPLLALDALEQFNVDRYWADYEPPADRLVELAWDRFEVWIGIKSRTSTK